MVGAIAVVGSVAGAVLCIGFAILAGRKLAEARQRRAYARLGQLLGASPTVRGRHATSQLWGVAGSVDGISVDVETTAGKDRFSIDVRSTNVMSNAPLVTQLTASTGSLLGEGVICHAELVPSAKPADWRMPGQPFTGIVGGRVACYGTATFTGDATSLADALQRANAALFLRGDRIEAWFDVVSSARSVDRVKAAVDAAVAVAVDLKERRRSEPASEFSY